MARRTWILVCLGASLPLTAAAENRPTKLEDGRPDAKPVAIELELGWFTDSEGDSTIHVLAPALSARVSASRSVDLVLDWPFSFLAWSADDSDDSSFRTGNPFLGLFYVDRRRVAYFRLGLGVSPPLVQVDQGSLDAVVNSGAQLAVHGLWNAWLYVPEHLSIVLPAGFELRRNALVVGGDLGVGFLLPTSEPAGDADVTLQIAGHLGGKIDTVTLGMRLQVAWLATANEMAQVAMVPFIQADFPTGAFVYLRMHVNLDEPYGVFGDGAGDSSVGWLLCAGAGARF